MMALKKLLKCICILAVMLLISVDCMAGIDFKEGCRAIYKLTDNKGSLYFVEYAVIKKEGDDVWIQAQVKTVPDGPPEIISQMLINNPDELLPVKMLIQPKGQEAVWIKSEGMGAIEGTIIPVSEENARKNSPDAKEATINTAAGTFQCVHITTDTAQTWISNKVGPLAIIKIVTENGNILELFSYDLKGAKDLIPKKPKE